MYINITDLLPVNSSKSFSFDNTDLVLTTVRKPITSHPGTYVIPISSYLSPEDYLSLEKYISDRRFSRFCPVSPEAPSLNELLQNAVYHANYEKRDRLGWIDALSQDFEMDHLVTSAYAEDIKNRENILGFAAKPAITLLYSREPAAETRLSIAILNHRVIWDAFKIRVIIMISTTSLTDFTISMSTISGKSRFATAVSASSAWIKCVLRESSLSMGIQNSRIARCHSSSDTTRAVRNV